MDKFEQSEEIGRAKLLKFLKENGIENCEFNEDKYGIYDAIYFGKDGKMRVAEIKNRDKRYENYNDMLIEKQKYDALNELVGVFKPELVDAVYFNFYNDSNKVKATSITDKNVQFRPEIQVRTTSGDTTKIQKLVGYIKQFSTYFF